MGEELSCIQIQGPEYVIRNSGTSWDLYLLKVVNKGKENQKFEFRPEGYGLKFETCLLKIISYRTKLRGKSLKKGDEDLIKYMKIWMEEKTKLLSILNLNEKEWSTISSLKKIPFEQLKQRDLIEADIDDSEEEIEED
jgi:hypothetical protein